MTKAILPLLLLALSVTLAHADYEYRYIEGEAFNRTETGSLRDEGFTSWMAHPSGGKVAVFGSPAGGFLEYDVKGLQPGEYYLYVRCLALPITRTMLQWDGQDLGLIAHDVASTSLRWSKPVKVTVAGDHVLRLQGSADSAQWPYIDTILLTNQPGYVPPTKDADFVSYKTAWPLLLVDGDAEMTMAPTPLSQPKPLPGLRFENLTMQAPVLGTNSVQLTVTSTAPRTLKLVAAFSGDKLGPAPATAVVTLKPEVPQVVRLQPVADRSGAASLVLSVAPDGGYGSYLLTIPPAATIALDEYAYPATQKQGKWTATFACSPDLLPQMQCEVTLSELPSGRVSWKRTVQAENTVQLPLDIAKMPIGRYQLSTNLLWNGKPTQSDSREFIIFKPAPFPAWEPIRTTKAVGDTIEVNGKPFLGLMAYHAPRTPEMTSYGFNVMQCFGSDPNPLDSIQKHLDDCQKSGLYGTVALFNNQFFNKGPQFDLAHLEEAVLRFKDHPALLCWDLIDEPEPTMKPEAVQAGADLIRKLDPNHFVWVNLCRNTQITDYLASQDLWSYDFYPFPTLSPFSFKTSWLNQTDQQLLGKRPLGTCLQTFNYNRHEQRMPSPDELRTSAWMHVIHGYKWFGYYSYYDGEPSGSLSNTPELLSYARALNTELSQLQNVILAPGLWQPVKMSSQNDKLEAREKKVGEKWYVVVVSDSKDPQQVKLRPTLTQGKRRLLIETDKPAATGTTIETTVRPFATQVWELTK